MKPVHSLAILALIGSTATTAHAASGDAWAEFRTEVGKACIGAAKSLIVNGRTLVDDFGSEKYGLAIVSGNPAGVKGAAAKATISTICVFDKKTKKAEIGGEISADKLTVKTGK